MSDEPQRKRPRRDAALDVPSYEPPPTPPRIYEPLHPPPDAIKCEDWEQESPTLPWAEDARCRNCNVVMWSRQPDLHDICETCGWVLREQAQEAAAAQRARVSTQFVNPFTDGFLRGQSGSLPTQKEK